MYKQVPIDPERTFKNPRNYGITPVVLLADEYGGEAIIYVDDHCYVLALKQVKVMVIDGQLFECFAPTVHWFREAIEIVRSMPLPE